MSVPRVVACGVDICKEMAIVWQVVGGEVVLQLGDGIDKPELGDTVHIFTILGALCARYSHGQPKSAFLTALQQRKLSPN